MSLNSNKQIPPRSNFISAIHKLIEVYKLWHKHLPEISKTCRQTLCFKIDSLFIELLDLLFVASFSSKQNKEKLLETGIKILDKIKFFLQILWEIKMIETTKYTLLILPLKEIGIMIYRWKQSLEIQ